MSRVTQSSGTPEVTESQHGSRRLGRAQSLAVVLTGVVTLAVGLVGVSAGTAATALAAPAVSPAASAGAASSASTSGGSCQGLSTVRVRATRSPFLNRRHIQEGIVTAEGRRNGCVLLMGQFNLGVCVLCLTVTRPVTVSGEADPTGSSSDRRGVTVVSTTGGAGSLVVNESANAALGVVQIRDIWWKGSSIVGLLTENFYRGTLEFTQNRVTGVRPRGRIRVGIGAARVFPGTEVLRGSLVVQDNSINIAGTPPVLDDNGIALVGTQFNTVDVSRNTVITRGASVQIEGGLGSSYNVADNTLVTLDGESSPVAQAVVTVGYPRLHGGVPATLKLAGNDVADLTVLNNSIVTGGGSRNLVCINDFQVPPSRFHPIRLTEISGNRCTMSGIFAGLLGGWAGNLSLWRPGTLDDAVVSNNTFVGTAAFGIAMLDFKVPLAPDNNLVNTSHRDVFRHNDFSAFTAGKATLYFGPSTHDNIFVGALRGTVVNLGRHNVIIAR